MNKTTQKFTNRVNPQTNFINQPAQMLFATSNTDIKYHNILDTAATIFREEGMIGFFSGLRMRIAIQSFSSAIAWGTYQVIKTALGNSSLVRH